MTTRENNATDGAKAPAPPAARKAQDTQPPPSGGPGQGANQGSPAAPVMKQFSKTDAESGGRDETK